MFEIHGKKNTIVSIVKSGPRLYLLASPFWCIMAFSCVCVCLVASRWGRSSSINLRAASFNARKNTFIPINQNGPFNIYTYTIAQPTKQHPHIYIYTCIHIYIELIQLRTIWWCPRYIWWAWWLVCRVRNMC